MKSEDLNLRDISIYQNAKETARRQFNLSLSITLIEEINTAQQGLQLLVDSFVGKGEMIENVLRKGIDSPEVAVIIDNKPYSFKELRDIAEWTKEVFDNFKYRLSSISGIEEVVQRASFLFDIQGKTLDLTNIDNESRDIFKESMYSDFQLAGNEYYPIRNIKSLESIHPFASLIEVALYLYTQFKVPGNEYSSIKQEIKDLRGEMNDSELNDIIIKAAINYICILPKSDIKIFTDEKLKSNSDFLEMLEKTFIYGVDFISEKSENTET